MIDDALSEADVQRMWRDLQTQPGERRGWAAVSGRRARTVRVVAIGAACSLALCGALALWLLPATAPHPAGPLAIVSANATRNGLGPAQVFGGAQPARLELDDGSHVALGRAARLEVLENSSRTFATQLRSGRGEFEVKPGGPRRWSIACGAVTVEVVGTHFAIDRSEHGVRVNVSRGVVLVRGASVADRVQRLSAGQSLYVPSTAATTTPTAVPPAPVIPLPVTLPPPAMPAMSPAPPAPSLDTQTQPHQPALAAATVELWLRQADDARRHGQQERAEALLERVVQTARGSAHAALAALTLARLLMDDEPARAAAALTSVDGPHTPNGLREDIMARLVEARARAGQLDLAREAAASYIRAFPGGRRLDEVRHWANLP